MATAPSRDPKKPFLSELQEIRRARQHIEQGAVTENNKADLATSIRVLNEALATEIVCVLRYKPVVFPDPLRPSRASLSPGSTAKLRS